ncbi:Antitoxin RelB [Klebsiella pneumoniae]|nr:Antitoxin RelB [Klebsiella pneumoniae]
MAMVNARIDDELKARVDAVLQRRNITVTQNMTDLYRYIDQHEQSPFLPAPRPHTAGECCGKVLF